MGDYGWVLFKKGLKRRGREVRRMRVMTCLAVFFLVLTLLLQDNIGSFRMEMNYRNYGRWLAYASDGFFDKDRYLEKTGEVYTGSFVYLTHPKVSVLDGSFENDIAPTADETGKEIKPPITDENGEFLPPEPQITVENFGYARSTSYYIGAFSEGFAEDNGIRLYEGRLPETDNEIAMELALLQALGVSYEPGQEISFYVARTVPEYENNGINIVDGEIVHRPQEAYLTLDLVTFRLVGTLMRYTARWSGGAYMPSAVITKGAYDSLPCFKTSYSFYGLAGGMEEPEPWKGAQIRFAQYEQRQEEYLSNPDNLKPDGDAKEIHRWNTEAYTSPLWGSAKAYRYMTVLLIVMSVCVLSYLMATYLGKRRQFFLQMREIGATTGEVWKMAANECVMSALPFAAAAVAAAYAAALLASFAISKASSLRFLFTFKFGTLLLSIYCVIAVLVLSLAAALLIFSGRSVSAKKKGFGRSAMRAVSRRAKKLQGRKGLGFEESLRRGRLIQPLRTLLLRIVCILVGAAILFSFARLFKSAWEYSALKNGKIDFIGRYRSNCFDVDVTCTADVKPKWNEHGTKKVDTEELVFSSETFFSSSKTLGKQFLSELDEVPGIKSVSYILFDNTHPISWKGCENDPFLNYCIEEGLARYSETVEKLRYDGEHLDDMRRCMANTFYRLYCYMDADVVWETLSEYLDPAAADKAAFERGEQVIMLVDTEAYKVDKVYGWGQVSRQQFAEEAENKWEALGHSFDPGDSVSIESHRGEDASATEVTVAAVVPFTDYMEVLGTGNSVFGALPFDTINDGGGYDGIFTAVGSMELAEKVQLADGDEFGFNDLSLKFSSVAESENTMKFVSAMCVRYGIVYYDTVEDTYEAREETVNSVLTYGFFSFVLTVLFIFVIGSIAKEERVRLVPQVREFIRFGASERTLRRQKSADAALQSLWQLLSVPLALAASIASEAASAMHGEGETTAENALRNAASQILGNRSLVAAVIFGAVVLMAVSWLVNRRIATEEERTGSTTGRRGS